MKKKRKNLHDRFEDFFFPDDVIEIHLYQFVISDDKIKKYIIELHIYDGFAMLKFYPRHLKDNKRRYEIRGTELGFHLSSPKIMQLLLQCAYIMKDYLEKNPNNFVGYVGQPDSKDDENKKMQSQRSDVYNLLTNSIFIWPKYKLSSKSIFQEINLRLIRKVTSKQVGKITSEQMINYKKFLSFFKVNKNLHFDLMTAETKKKYNKKEI